MLKYVLIIIIFCFLLLSCKNKKTYIEKPLQQENVNQEIVYIDKQIYSTLSPEEIFNLLDTLKDKYSDRPYYEIIFFQKVNFGIVGGDNYIVLWDVECAKVIHLYVVSDKIEKDFFVSTIISDKFDDYYPNLMKNIPGIHIENIGVSIFDFNGDGIDELLEILIYPHGKFLLIYDYDAIRNKIANYFDENSYSIPFKFIDENEESSPIEFTHYKNKVGFKIYSEYNKNIPTVNIIDNKYAWYFYAFDEGIKYFKNMGEYLED